MHAKNVPGQLFCRALMTLFWSRLQKHVLYEADNNPQQLRLLCNLTHSVNLGIKNQKELAVRNGLFHSGWTSKVLK
ncbi:hypothetical protein E2320_015471 [Naja naja]|nr:hypothetical protein E2320_015471 [Naja naja]